jgi:hypothetical protein
MEKRALQFLYELGTENRNILGCNFSGTLSKLLIKFAKEEIEFKKNEGLRKLKKAVDYDDSDHAVIEIDSSVGGYNKHFE